MPQPAAAPRPAAPRTHRSRAADCYRCRRQGRWGPPAGRGAPGPAGKGRGRCRALALLPGRGLARRPQARVPAASRGRRLAKRGLAPSPGGAARPGRGLQLPALRGAALRRRRRQRPRKRKRLPREPTSPSGRSMNGSVAGGGGGFSEEVISLTRRPSGEARGGGASAPSGPGRPRRGLRSPRRGGEARPEPGGGGKGPQRALGRRREGPGGEDGEHGARSQAPAGSRPRRPLPPRREKPVTCVRES